MFNLPSTEYFHETIPIQKNSIENVISKKGKFFL